jgi:ankyrin repeat protein
MEHGPNDPHFPPFQEQNETPAIRSISSIDFPEQFLCFKKVLFFFESNLNPNLHDFNSLISSFSDSECEQILLFFSFFHDIRPFRSDKIIFLMCGSLSFFPIEDFLFYLSNNHPYFFFRLYQYGTFKKIDLLKLSANNIFTILMTSLIGLPSVSSKEALFTFPPILHIFNQLDNSYGYFKDSLESACKYDDLDHLTSFLSLSDFNILEKLTISQLDLPFNEEIIGQSLLSFTAFYGANKCFKIILLNNDSDSGNAVASSIKGGNFEIINALHQLHADFASHFNEAFFYYRNEVADWILLNYHVTTIYPLNSIVSMNFQGFSFIVAHYHDQIKLQNLLCSAAYHGYLNLIFYIVLSLHADVNSPNEDGDFPLNLSGGNGHYQVTKFLITHGANVNQFNSKGATTLAVASQNGLFKMVSYLLSKGADPNISLNILLLPIFLAVNLGHKDIINILIAHDSIFDITLSDGTTLLMIAIQQNLNDFVQFLISKGANCQTQTTKHITPLHLACSLNNYTIVQMLLHAAVDINSKTNSNESPLFIAAKNGYYDIVLHLITHGADVHAPTIDNHTPFIAACAHGHIGSLKLLLYNNAKINEKTHLGETGLYLAVIGGHIETVKFLVKYGADANILTNDGSSIIKAAISAQKIAIVNFLFKSGIEDHIPQNAELINFVALSEMPLYFFKKEAKSIIVLHLPDNSSNLSCSQLVCFIHALPVSFEAKDSKKSDSGNYFRYYNICDSQDPKKTLLRISSSQDFSNNRIEITSGASTFNIITIHQKSGYASQFYQDGNHNHPNYPMVKFEQFENLQPNHPYNKIGKNIKKKDPQLFKTVFDDEVLSQKTLRNRDYKQLIIPLLDVLNSYEGDVFITENSHLASSFIYGDKYHIRTMTWLIPNITTVLSNCQYIELDASFQASHPYVYTVPQAIIHNEAVPLGFTLAPTERMDLYKEFYDAITRAYPQFDLHMRIPILTDEGTGLLAFAKLYHLEHYLCYKHLLFKFIQNSNLYFLVRRIIFCSTPEKLQMITLHVQMTAALIFQKSTAHKDAFENIFQWSYNIQTKEWTRKPTNFINQSLWVRNAKGIGTTTNHAESFHRTMNINTKTNDDPSKKAMNFRNNIVRKIKSNNTKNGRQIREFIGNEQKRAFLKNIIQVEKCEKCDTSRFRARFMCDVPCIHTCLAYDLTKIPPFTKISMKTTRPNIIHTLSIEDNWTFAEERRPGLLNSNEEVDDSIPENQDEFEDIDYVIYECAEILHVDASRIHREFISGVFSAFENDHLDKNEDEVQALFTIHIWNEAHKIQNGVFRKLFKNEKPKSA